MGADRGSMLRRGPVAAVALAAAFGAGAAAQTPGPPGSWPAPPRGAQAGGFHVLQFSTTNAEAVVAEWRKPTPGVRIDDTHQVRLGQPVTTFVVFGGCKPDAQGLCDVRAAVELFDPAGKPSVKATAKVWVGQPAPPPQILRLSTDGVTVTFARPDPVGPYRVRSTVTDRVAGVTLTTEETLTVLP